MYLYEFLLIFGVVILVAGVQGLLAGSKVSLIAAAVLGGCVLVGAFLLGRQTALGLVLALVGSLGIAGRFVPGFFKAKNKVAALWPAGVLGILSIVALVMVLKALI
jgi:uncharacterized membrane protein (UPF0136 family)